MSLGAGASKKPKTYHFHWEWEEDFFFTMSNSKCICLICRASIAIPKKGNVERHYRTVHKNYDSDFPPKSELRKRQVTDFKLQLSGQQSLFTQPGSDAKSVTWLLNSKSATEASLRVSHSIIKHKKAFQDGEMVKEAFLEAADSLFRDFKNKPEIMSSIKALQLSRNSVTRHCEMMGDNLTQQLRRDIADCECFSLQFDECTNISDTSQLCIFIRMVFGDMTAKEELLTLLPMKEHAQGEDIFQIFKNFVDKTQLPVYKLVSITTDGAPAMVGRFNEFIAKCREDDALPSFLQSDKRFQDFALLEPIATFMCNPFGEDTEVDSLASNIATLFHMNAPAVEDEMLTLQSDIRLKSRAHGQFWNLLTEEKYPNMRKCATSLTALFGSTYMCDSAFSHIKIIKSKYRSTMTDDHLEACLRLATSSYCPDYATLSHSLQCRSSSDQDGNR
ncbi:hypothetical protein ACEWY4_018283 [Coilia grayii]|uniref:Uncharacterized protein n=1 Tax=Coilia grayii TaxID=363190 RepID=A0ABD1JJF4_9TELE